jgi:signal transduction histidine kinase
LPADEQRKKRAELEETARQLERVNQELRDSSEHLKRADRLAAIGNLSAGLAHEIRNPLASIEGATGILESGQVGEEQEREFLGIIKKELILWAFRKSNWNQTRAAALLDLSRKTFIYRMEKHRIPKENPAATC